MSTSSVKKLVLGLSVVIAAAGVYQYARALPAITPQGHTPAAPKTAAAALPWPATGQAGLGAEGFGVLDSHGRQTPVSIASIAKVVTALAVLQKKPLSPGGQGPTITLDQTDVDYFNYYYTRDGSVANVAAGEQITEYQMLQAMLIPSANNMGDSLARWAFGSTQAYVAYANRMVKSMGLTQTAIGNTNGFDDTTVSTAGDLVKLGLAALKEPVVAGIVGQKTANIPVQGKVNNVNWLLGSDGVVGIKTGNTDKAGGCYLFAAKRQILGRTVTMAGAVLGANDLAQAIRTGRDLLAAADGGFQKVIVITKGQVLGNYKALWGAASRLTAAKELALTVWKGRDIEISSSFEPAAAPAKAGAALGSVRVAGSGQSASSPLVLSQDLPGPSLTWRLLRN